ncbi:hypothetical protein ABZ920_08720 [Streptomyces sp. NPDC046831]|uniref:hypothetical protein n=1 Tax=Streptomyces sp. NPDC046831 TaxID=3154805 RepID=UPI0034012F59
MSRSEYADVPAVELPVHGAVLGGAAAFGETPALIDGTDGTQRVRRVTFVDAVPRAASGKILRREPRDARGGRRPQPEEGP